VIIWKKNNCLIKQDEIGEYLQKIASQMFEEGVEVLNVTIIKSGRVGYVSVDIFGKANEN